MIALGLFLAPVVIASLLVRARRARDMRRSRPTPRARTIFIGGFGHRRDSAQVIIRGEPTTIYFDDERPNKWL